MDARRHISRLVPRLAYVMLKVLDINQWDPSVRQQGQTLVVLAIISIAGAATTLFFSLTGIVWWPHYISAEASAVLGLLLAYLAAMGIILILVWAGRVNIGAVLWLALILVILFGVTSLNVGARAQHVPAVLMHLIVMAALIRGPVAAVVTAVLASFFEASLVLFFAPDSRLDLFFISVILNLMMAVMMSVHLRLNSAMAHTSQLSPSIRLDAGYIEGAIHDANVQLDLINGYVQVINQTDAGKLSQTSRDALAHIQLNTRRLIDEMDELMDFIELERGTLPLNIREADPTIVMYSIVGQLNDAAESRGLRLSCVCDPKLPTAVKQDWPLLRHTLVRLIESAIVSMADGGHVSLQVRLHRPDEWLIRIQDTAQGFVLLPGWEALRNTTGPKSRRDRARRLAHTNAVVKTLGGAMDVQVDRRRGTTIVICLPH